MTGTGDSPPGTGALVVAVDAEGFNSAATHLFGLLIAGLSAVVLAMIARAWILTGRALSAVARITEDAEAVGPQELAAGLPVPRRDTELAGLIGALNRMLARLHHSHTTELAFAADAGRRRWPPTPNTRRDVARRAELAVRETDPAELTAALERVVADADQLTSIIDRMLARRGARKPNPELVRDASSRAAHAGGVGLSSPRSLSPYASTSASRRSQFSPTCRDCGTHHRQRPSSHTPGWQGRHRRPTRNRPPRDTGGVDLQHRRPHPARPREHVFDAWVSGRDASVAGGLGLWLARKTARDLGGHVEIVDDPSPRVRLRLVGQA